MTTRRSVERIAVRTGGNAEEVVEFSQEFRLMNMSAVFTYLEKRIDTMRGDENPKFELEQVRKDLALLATLSLPEVRSAFEAG